MMMIMKPKTYIGQELPIQQQKFLSQTVCVQ